MERMARWGTAMMAVACVWTSAAAQTTATPPAGTDRLTIDNIFGESALLGKLPSAVRWAGNSAGVTYLTDIADITGDKGTRRALVMREVPSGKQSILCIADTVSVPADLRRADADKSAIGGYEWNRAGTQIVFSFHDELFTLDAKTRRIQRRTQVDGAEHDPMFSPDGTKIAFSRDHDLYVLDLATHDEVRLTATGCDSVYNGILDWVYMEELFTRGEVRSFWWSPDSKRLAFLEIREAPVPEFPMVDVGSVHPSWKLQHYPKAGDPNPIVRVGMVRAGGGDIVWSDTDTSDDSYIARVYWLGDSGAVAVEKLNRAQDRLTLLLADAGSGRMEVVFEETHSTWINVNYLKHYFENGRQFIWGSERDGHSHLYLYNLDGTVARQITSGEWEVMSLDAVDEKKGRVYFTANEADVRERQFYSVDEKGGKIRRITTEPGDHTVTVSPNSRYYIDRFNTEARPSRIAVCSIDGRELFEIGDEMTPELRAVRRPVPEFLTIEKDGRTYYASVTKPLNFDPRRQYPVIVYVYGGPHAQVVRKAWSRHNLWHSMMADRGYVVFSLDNRGSYGRGRDWEDTVAKNLGHYELEDQLMGVEYMKSQAYVDPDRIGIWGWSYGGYMTLLAMLKASDVFKAGISVAPVTDWRLYDSIYTERYMKRPQDNETGYHDSAPLNFSGGLRGSLLLVHGDADDNVHAQNSIQMIRSFIDAGRDFDFMLHPQKEHGLSGSADRSFLYGKMMRFFDRNLMGAEKAVPPMNP